MSDCQNCGQENYGSPPGPLQERIRELEAELGAWQETFDLRNKRTALWKARVEKAEADLKWVRSQPIVIENVHLKARVAELERRAREKEE